MRFNIENHTANIALNSAENNNALSLVMIQNLMDAFHKAENNVEVQSIILFTDHKNFCAGADLNHMLTMGKAPYAENLLDAQKFVKFFSKIYYCGKPTICCVQGKTMGGGLGLMAACDMTVAEKNSTFCFSEVKLGLIPAIISPFVLKRIGFSHAKKLMQTAEIFDATEANRIGLIDHVVENSLQKGLEIALSLQKNNFSAMRNIKKWLNTISPMDQNILEKSAEKLADMRSMPETQACIENFFRKARNS